MKNRIWNNTERNGSTIKNHSKLHYQIIHTSTYIQQPKCIPSNIDTFLTNVSYFHNCHTIDDLPSNPSWIYSPNAWNFKPTGKQYRLEYLCKILRQKKNPFLSHGNNRYRNQRSLSANPQFISHRHPTGNNTKQTQPPTPLLYNLIKERNRQRRNYQKFGNSLHKLNRNMLTTAIQKRI